MAKIATVKGHNSASPRRFCNIKGAHAPAPNHCYFPSKMLEGSRRVALWSPRLLRLRSRESIKDTWEELSAARAKAASHRIAKDAGIDAKAVLFASFPHLTPCISCPLDTMHLLHLNGPKRMWEMCAGLVKRDLPSRLTDFSISSCEQIGKDMAAAAKRAPECFGRPPRSVWKKWKSFKAEEGKLFARRCSLPLLRGRLDHKHLTGWKHFVEACRICALPDPAREEVIDLRRHAALFFEHCERDHFKRKKESVKMMKYVLHLILHLADGMEQAGPLRNVDQLKMERFAGNIDITLKAKFRI
eukprot:Plantae.Rhodophyta-Hildenbrandia_rubra.ctg16499.p1 GENE.Plantae.Rhodophyta-Hildenbrandia_rubra.ctg16499~~Plantae.Rhodophyta-Hildenbrandia_rubra.ctg16499.p1  ORF type:complete len:330 (+),score=35.68 Plantae.Rhodophyta-Hildenbrandia_rubra.ctg16499:90-992(+)